MTEQVISTTTGKLSPVRVYEHSIDCLTGALTHLPPGTHHMQPGLVSQPSHPHYTRYNWLQFTIHILPTWSWLINILFLEYFMSFDNDIFIVEYFIINSIWMLILIDRAKLPFKLMHKFGDAWKICSIMRRVSIHNHISRILRWGGTDKNCSVYLNVIKRPVLEPLRSLSSHSLTHIFLFDK